MKLVVVALCLVSSSSMAFAADPIKQMKPTPHQSLQTSLPTAFPVLKGRVVVIDGRTLWFPARALRVRLADLDACELPQWALDPKWNNRKAIKAPPPVPCGAFAKAWLTRTIGSASATCSIISYGSDAIARARCLARGRDLALEMLRVGWARVDSPDTIHPEYLNYQQVAMAARYGMWATYVLDMNEWRRKAVDKSLSRQPIADFDLLAERKSEISPPFNDVRRQPNRTDR